MRVGLIPTVETAFGLFRRHGAALYLDFFLAMVASSLILSLLYPDATYGKPVDSFQEQIINSLTSPAMIVMSVINALVMCGAIARVWRFEGGALPQNLSWSQLALPLVLQVALVDYLALALFFPVLIPSFICMALTCVLIPAMVLEAQGWNGIVRAVQLTRPYLLALTGIWVMKYAAFLLPAILLGAERPAEGTPYNVWQDILAHFWLPVSDAVSVCLIIAIYQRLIALEHRTG